MSERISDEQIISHTLSYDPDRIAEAVGATGPVLPKVRCIEDRPREDDARQAMIDPTEHTEAYLENLQRQVRSLSDATESNRVWSASSDFEPPNKDLWIPETATMAHNAVRTGLSMPGGLMSLALGRMLAQEVQSPGSISGSDKTARQYVEALFAVAPDVGELHGDTCAARIKLNPILRFLVTKPDEAFAVAQQATPNIDESLFGKHVDASERLIRSGVVHDGQPAPQHVPMRPLIKKPETPSEPVEHAATFVAAINNRSGDNVLWDTYGAWNAGLPGYAANVDLLHTTGEALNRRLSDIHGVSPKTTTDGELFTHGVLAYLGATIPNLPGKPRVHRIGDAI